MNGKPKYVIMRIVIKEDADFSEVLSECSYSFSHPAIVAADIFGEYN